MGAVILSDRTITQMLKSEDIGIYPTPEPEQIQPVSVDLLLGNSFVVWPMHPADPEHRTGRAIRTDKFLLPPQTFVLANTRETVKIPHHIVGMVHGKSTLARQGLQVHAAGLVDPGFIGELTLELFNMSSHPLALFAGMRICQITFEAIDLAVQRPYGSEGLGSHYQGQTGATLAAS